MKKVIIISFLVILIFLSACTKVPEEKLGELQIIACEQADKAGTCETRLIEVGIIMPEDCCKVLGKCC